MTFAFGEYFPQVDYDGYKSGGSSSLTMYHDLSKLDFGVLEVQKFFIPKWIDEAIQFTFTGSSDFDFGDEDDTMDQSEEKPVKENTIKRPPAAIVRVLSE